MEEVKRKPTDNGYDNLWVLAINGVLEDREADLRIKDLDDALWERFIGPMINAIEDGDWVEEVNA